MNINMDMYGWCTQRYLSSASWAEKLEAPPPSDTFFGLENFFSFFSSYHIINKQLKQNHSKKIYIYL